MQLTLGQAAKQAGKSKGTISKALSDGRLSGIRNEDGSWSINVAELQRWMDATRSRKPLEVAIATYEIPSGNGALETEIKMLREQLDHLRDERDDLRRRLDAEAEERRQEAAENRRLTALLLVDQRPPAPQTAQRRGWWRFWEG